MELILNIGLNTNTNGNIGVGTVLRDVEAHGFELLDVATHWSDTEQTVVARVGTGPVPDGAVNFFIGHLARLLSQDCIAVYNPATREGYLIGPKADDWGPFNPEFFILVGGSRLAPSPAPHVAERQAQLANWANQRNLKAAA
jgi:hypothetical protein